MRAFVLAILAAASLTGCKASSPKPAAQRDAAPSVAYLADAAPPPVAAAPPPADAAPPASRTLDELLTWPKDAPPQALAGVALGASPPLGDSLAIPLTGCGDEDSSYATVSWKLGADRNVRHVTLEVECGETSAAKVATRAAGWGGATRLGGRRAWRGPGSVVTIADHDGFLRGTPSVVIDLVPPTDDVVCAGGDGFAEFLARFRRQLALGDAAAVAAAMTYPIDVMEATDDDLAIETSGELVARFDTILPPAIRAGFRKAKRTTCNLSQEVYWWEAGEWHFEIARVGSTWKANGPRWMTHDTNLDPDSP